jgi:hypothetical protein
MYRHDKGRVTVLLEGGVGGEKVGKEEDQKEEKEERRRKEVKKRRRRRKEGRIAIRLLIPVGSLWVGQAYLGEELGAA